jgi:hypothetical protein
MARGGPNNFHPTLKIGSITQCANKLFVESASKEKIKAMVLSFFEGLYEIYL